MSVFDVRCRCDAEVHYAVLDEADRMLDEGFEPAIRKIMAQCATPCTHPGRLRWMDGCKAQHDIIAVVKVPISIIQLIHRLMC